MPFLNFTPELGTVTTILYNQSYAYANQPPMMTTQTVWIVFTLVGIGLLLFSRFAPEETCKDLSGVLAWLFVLVSMLQSFAVDTITSTVYAQSTTSPTPLGIIAETHTIYHYDLIGVVLAIVWAICWANLYLLYLDYKKVTTQQETPMDRVNLRYQGKPQKKNTGDDDEEEK